MIMILSESFSDQRAFPASPCRKTRCLIFEALKNTTTSGLMLSPGYGGGTANIEYQALTGWVWHYSTIQCRCPISSSSHTRKSQKLSISSGMTDTVLADPSLSTRITKHVFA